jgi:hypothetical protein
VSSAHVGRERAGLGFDLLYYLRAVSTAERNADFLHFTHLSLT